MYDDIKSPQAGKVNIIVLSAVILSVNTHVWILV